VLSVSISHRTACFRVYSAEYVKVKREKNARPSRNYRDNGLQRWKPCMHSRAYNRAGYKSS